MSFDGITLDCPLQRLELERWLEARRGVAFQPQREDQCWKEWWCLHALIARELPREVFPQEFVARRQTDVAEPDFSISGTNLFKLEVTEATNSQERQAIALSRQCDDPRPVRVGERTDGSGNLIPGQRAAEQGRWEQFLCDDITSAIRRKSKKPYALGNRLLVYPNSDVTFAQPDGVISILKSGKLNTPFTDVYVLWPDEYIIHLRGGYIALVGK